MCGELSGFRVTWCFVILWVCNTDSWCFGCFSFGVIVEVVGFGDLLGFPFLVV